MALYRQMSKHRRGRLSDARPDCRIGKSMRIAARVSSRLTSLDRVHVTA